MCKSVVLKTFGVSRSYVLYCRILPLQFLSSFWRLLSYLVFFEFGVLFHRKLVGWKRALRGFKLIIFVCRPAGNGASKTTNMSGRYVFYHCFVLTSVLVYKA